MACDSTQPRVPLTPRLLASSRTHDGPLPRPRPAHHREVREEPQSGSEGILDTVHDGNKFIVFLFFFCEGRGLVMFGSGRDDFLNWDDFLGFRDHFSLMWRRMTFFGNFCFADCFGIFWGCSARLQDDV